MSKSRLFIAKHPNRFLIWIAVTIIPAVFMVGLFALISWASSADANYGYFLVTYIFYVTFISFVLLLKPSHRHIKALRVRPKSITLLGFSNTIIGSIDRRDVKAVELGYWSALVTPSPLCIFIQLRPGTVVQWPLRREGQPFIPLALFETFRGGLLQAIKDSLCKSGNELSR
jgi:hypothetical protein